MSVVFDYLERLSVKKFVLLVFLVYFISHIWYIALAPSGYHQWRQTQGLSVARNYADEDMNFFLPRVDSRGEFTGITGLEFPIIYYLAAVSYKIFGFNNITPRVMMMLIAFFTLWASRLFFEKISGSAKYGKLGTLLLLFSPLFHYYSFNVMTESAALGCTFMAFYYLLNYSQSGRLKQYAAFLLFIICAGLLKTSFLLGMFFIVYVLWQEKARRTRDFLLLFAALCVMGSWYAYARYLSFHYQNFDFVLSAEFIATKEQYLAAVKKAFLQWLPEVTMNFATTVLFFFGIAALVTKRINGLTRKFIVLYGAGVLLFMASMLRMFRDHDYYLMPLLPLLLVLALEGVKFLESRNFYRQLLAPRLLVFLLFIAVPLLGLVRGNDRFYRAKNSIEPGTLTLESFLAKRIPDSNSRVIAIDGSPSILLYFANRNGWSYPDTVSVAKLESARGKGAKYVISADDIFNCRQDIKSMLDVYDRHYIYTVFRFR